MIMTGPVIIAGLDNDDRWTRPINPFARCPHPAIVPMPRAVVPHIIGTGSRRDYFVLRQRSLNLARSCGRRWTLGAADKVARNLKVVCAPGRDARGPIVRHHSCGLRHIHHPGRRSRRRRRDRPHHRLFRRFHAPHQKPAHDRGEQRIHPHSAKIGYERSDVKCAVQRARCHATTWYKRSLTVAALLVLLRSRDRKGAFIIRASIKARPGPIRANF
jgi:hypothetical protein